MSYRIAIPERVKPLLEELAIAHDCWHGQSPSIPLLITKLADGKLHQSNANVESLSFFERLVLAIAKGTAANPAIAELPPSGFREKVMDRANAILGDDFNDNVFSE